MGSDPEKNKQSGSDCPFQYRYQKHHITRNTRSYLHGPNFFFSELG